MVYAGLYFSHKISVNAYKINTSAQFTSIHWATVMWLIGNVKELALHAAGENLPWDIFLPPLLSFLSLPQKILNFFLGSSFHGLQEDVRDPLVYIVDDKFDWSQGPFWVEDTVTAEDLFFCLNAVWVCLHTCGSISPFLLAWGIQSCHPLSLSSHASLAWVLSTIGWEFYTSWALQGFWDEQYAPAIFPHSPFLCHWWMIVLQNGLSPYWVEWPHLHGNHVVDKRADSKNSSVPLG